MREEKFTFNSTDGIHKDFGVRWVPDGEIRAIMQICHGMAEHIMRYREFGEYLADHGILVTGHDHPGHGRSAESEELYGYFADKNGNEIVLGDIHKVCVLTKKKYGELPYVLFGHSMGSFLARQYLCVHGEELDGAIISGTGYQAGITVGFGKTLCKILSVPFGWKHRSSLINSLSTGAYNKQFKPTRTASDWLSKDEKNVDDYIADPMCGYTFTLRGFYDMFDGLGKIIKQSDLNKMPKDLPVLFISGDEDPVGANGKGVRKVLELFKKAGMKQVQCKMYEGSRHEVLNDFDKERAMNDVWNWIDEIILRTK